MGNGFQFIDIILFGMVAAFLIFRLRNSLGKRDGHEGGFKDPFKPNPEKDDLADDVDPDDKDNVVHLSDRKQSDDVSDEASDENWDVLSDNENEAPSDHPFKGGEAIDDALADGLMQIQMADNSFDAAQFVEGASMAFEMILNAYAAGDTQTLKNLLSSEVYGNFSQAIKDREQAGEVLEDTLVEIKRADYLEAYVEARQAFVTVKFVSDQVNVTRDENGDVVDGNANEIITVTDIWTFSRDTRSRDPNWALVATSSLD
ncbi:MAG: Tim44 domain-containing protein [Rhodospirillales bacterium]|jgi:predicted lipid-binding transport protein (Tim44 family)|nr:Tim44 domain-containing protein [Rhodospirillales bacterium]